MRILYHHRTLADGAEGIHIHEMIEAFRELGHTVDVKALAKPTGRGAGHRGVLSSIRSKLPQFLYELALLAYNLREYWQLRKRLRESRPAFVYKRHALLDVGAILAARAENVPLILEVNRPYSAESYAAFEPLSFPGLAARVERMGFNAAPLIAVVSTPLKDYIVGKGIDSQKVMLTPNGANPDRFLPNPAAGLAIRGSLGLVGAVVVGWVGILREWHRLELLIDAVAGLPSTRLLIIGDGPDQSRLESLAKAKRIESLVVFAGRVPHERMPQYIEAFDIAVASDDRTGFASPMKILEYMAMSKPVVAPRMPNIQDLLDDGKDALLFNPGDVRDLMSTLRRLTTDPPLRASIGAAARRKVETERNWGRNARDVLAAMSSVPTGGRLPL